MKAINESIHNICPDSGSTKRLVQKLASVYRDSKDELFDDKLIDELKVWAFNPESVDRQITYLDSLKDDRGGFARSHKDPKSMITIIDSFRREEKSSFQWNRNYQNALAEVESKYPSNLKPIRYTCEDDIDEVISNWDTSSGWTGIVEGKQKKSDYRGEIFDRLLSIESRAIEDGSFNCPVIPGSRGQASGEFLDDGTPTGKFKRKTRPVWMTDIFQLVSEQRFAKPVTEWLTSYPGSAIGKDDPKISKWVFSMRNKYTEYLSLDYSKYDSSIPSWLIRDAFGIIRKCFKSLTKYEEDLLWIIEKDFIEKNVLYADGTFVHITHGNPSGSAFTSIINGICNEIITRTWCSALGFTVEYVIMGDDNLMFTSQAIHAPSVATYVEHNFGVKINSEKSTSGKTSQSPEFLSRFWTNTGPYRHPNILISKLAYPERFRKYSNRRDVQMVLYSYILGYEAGMRKVMDVDGFLGETRLLRRDLKSNKEVSGLPYNVRVAYGLV